MSRLLQILFGAFLVTFPFSIRFLVYEENAYRFGHFNPWVSEFVYLPEILLVITFALWFYLRIKNYELRITNYKLVILLGLFFSNALIVTFFQGDATLGFFFMARILEGVILYYLVMSKVLPPLKMAQILLAGTLFQLVLAAFQWKFNHSIGLGWLGEPAIGPYVLNVAKLDLVEDVKQIRSYGTFLHPNILAAYLVTLFFITLDLLKRRGKILCLMLMGLGIFLTQSFAAAIVGVMGIFLWILFAIFKNQNFRRKFSLALFLLLVFGNIWFFFNSHKIQMDDVSVRERLEQNVISREMFKAHPWGVGVRNFTLEMENFSEKKLKPWEFQPVHNTFFLILNETGIQGLILLLIIVGWVLYRYAPTIHFLPLLTLLLFTPFDHFLWDSFVGLMFVTLAIGFFTLHNQISEMRR